MKKLIIISLLTTILVMPVVVNASAADKNLTSFVELDIHDNYIFSSELKFNVNYNLLKEYTVRGYIKKSNMDGRVLNDIIRKNNYSLRPSSMQTDNENYFYGLSIVKHWIMEGGNGFDCTFSYGDNIKHNIMLEHTYVDVYKSMTVEVKYFEKRFTVPFNFFTSFSKNIDGVKNNMTVGMGVRYQFNDYLSTYFEYSYYRDMKDKNNVVLRTSDHQYVYMVDVNNLLQRRHSLKTITTVNFNGKNNIDLIFDYAVVERFGNVLYFGVGFEI